MNLQHWLSVPIPPISGATRLIQAFLREEPIVWDAFTLDDAQQATEHLIHYAPLEWAYDEWDEDTPAPNADNLWHPLLHLYSLLDTLKTLPGVCPPDIPFY